MIEILIHWFRLGGGLVFALFLANFSEPAVSEYTLPDLLHDGSDDSTQEWEQNRRGEILSLFEEHVYGPIPKEKPEMSVEILEEGDAFDGLATRKQVRLTYTRNNAELNLQLLIYIPVRGCNLEQSSEDGCPVVLTYNFEGNHTIIRDTDVLPSTVYTKRLPGVLKKFSENHRGKKIEKEHIPIEKLLEEGYAVVTLYYGDVDPDYNDGFKNGMHALYPEYVEKENYAGSISAWAWGLSRITDYLKTETSINSERVGLFGFSRLGKTALWAAANDERFKAVVTDSAGLGGSGLARRNFGETVYLMTYRFPHWFTGTYATYAGRENELPVDQHQLLALISPRPILVSVATKDGWSDPKGEIEAVKASGHTNAEYVIHNGKHAVTEDEWDDYIEFLIANL